MADQQVVVVFNAAGQLGGSVVRALVTAGNFRVRALVSQDEDLNSLEDVGMSTVEYVRCDMSNRESLKCALRGAHACFLHTETDFDNEDGLEDEIQRGKLVADVCQSEALRHVIFRSQLHCYKICSIMARHLVAKAEIELYMRELGLPLTCLLVPTLYQDLFTSLRPSSLDGQTYHLEIPMGSCPVDLMGCEDVGALVVCLLRDRSKYLGKTVSLCGDKLTVPEISAVLTKLLPPKVFKDKKITTYEFHRKKSGDLKGSADWANMFQFFQRVDQRYNILATKEIYPGLQSFQQWLAQHRSQVSAMF